MKSAQENISSDTEMEAKVKNDRMFGQVDADLLLELNAAPSSSAFLQQDINFLRFS